MAENADDIILQIRAQFDQARSQLDALKTDLNALKMGGENAAGGMTKLEKAVAGTRTTIGSLDKDFVAFGRNMGSVNDAFSAMGVRIPVTPMAAFGQAVMTVGRFVKDSVDGVTEYNKAISDLAGNIGASLEDTSRLVQVADDFAISQDQIKTAMQLAVKNGFEPSIDNLAELADLYVSIQDPVERAAVLTDKFGRNWATLTPILRNGGDALREQAAAVADGLVVTEASVKASEDYRLAVDELSDSWQAFSMNIGNTVIPALTSLLDTINTADVARSSTGISMSGVTFQIQKLQQEKEALKQARLAIESTKDVDMGYQYTPAATTPTATSGTTLSDGMNQVMWQQQQATAAKISAQQTANVTEKMRDLQLFMAGPVKKENQSYRDIQEELQKELRKTGAEIAALEAQPWRKKELEEAKEKYEGLGEQIESNAEEHKLASKKIIFDLAAQQMAQDGLTSAEADAQVELAKKFGLIDEQTAEMWNAIKKPVDEMANGKLTADEWVTAMEKLATNWDVNVTWHYKDPPVGTGTGGGKVAKDTKGKPGKQQAAASGIDFTVPTGYEDDSYPIWSSSGERVQITPPGKPGFDAGGGGGSITIYGRTTIVNGQQSATNRRAQLRSSRTA